MHDRQNGCGQKSFQLQKFLLPKGRQSCNCKIAPSHQDPIATGLKIQSAMTEWTASLWGFECWGLLNNQWDKSFTLLDYEALTLPLPPLPLLPQLLDLAIYFQQEYCCWFRTVRQKVKFHVTAHHDPCWLLDDKVPRCPLAPISCWVFVRSLIFMITSMIFLPAKFFTFIFPGSFLFSGMCFFSKTLFDITPSSQHSKPWTFLIWIVYMHKCVIRHPIIVSGSYFSSWEQDIFA